MPLKNLAKGFLAATGLIWACNFIALAKNSDNVTVMVSLLIFLSSVLGSACLWFRKNLEIKMGSSITAASSTERARTFLFGLQGVALACWIFDLTTTYYAIDITGVAVERNPLGWPLGILGALIYYAPTILLSYVLLFKIRQNVSFYGAIPMTIILLFMSMMNLHAGTQNFQIFTGDNIVATEIRYGLFTFVIAAGVSLPIVLREIVNRKIVFARYKFKKQN